MKNAIELIKAVGEALTGLAAVITAAGAIWLAMKGLK